MGSPCPSSYEKFSKAICLLPMLLLIGEPLPNLAGCHALSIAPANVKQCASGMLVCTSGSPSPSTFVMCAVLSLSQPLFEAMSFGFSCTGGVLLLKRISEVLNYLIR